MKVILGEELEEAMTRALVAGWKEIDSIKRERETQRAVQEAEDMMRSFRSRGSMPFNVTYG